MQPFRNNVRSYMLCIAACFLLSPGVVFPASAQAISNWARALGERVAQTNARFATIDRVVLVPDETTMLDELSKWTPSERWPVLLDDDTYAPAFIRRFGPEEIIRREPVMGRRPNGQAFRDAAASVIVNAWQPGSTSVIEAFQAAGHAPAGVVFSHHGDDARIAAVILAAGRGQPIVWLDERHGRPWNLVAQAEALPLLNQQVASLNGLRIPFAELGDMIDTLTFCMELPNRIKVGENQQGKPQFIATTDALGRRPDGIRFAFAGWIFGAPERSAYVAMSSLFLDRTDVTLVNTYPDDGAWARYGVADAAAALSDAGFTTSVDTGRSATRDAWLAQLSGGMRTDILMMNTKGNATWFEMSDGQQASAHDVPILMTPAVVHLIHSWSMMNPTNDGMLAPNWLDHGAYAFVGSVQEPFLSGFVPPETIAARLIAGVPFLVASRHWDGQPWRINTYGDPLMVCSTRATERVVRPASYGTNVRENLPSVMRQAQQSGDGADFARAIRDAHLLGEDRVAIDLWRLAREKQNANLAARASIPSMFRLRQLDAFVEAWLALGSLSPREVDMLWHLATPRLRGRVDGDLLTALQVNLRGPMTHFDVARLAPALASMFGSSNAQHFVQSALAETDHPVNQRELRKLANQYR